MSVDSRVGYTFGALVSVLLIAEVARFSLRRTQSAHELGQRIRSWWVIVLISAIALVVSPIVLLVLLAFVSYLALKEYFSIVPTRMTDRAVLLVAYLAVASQWWWIGAGHYGMFIIWVPVYLFVLIPSIMVLRGETAGLLRALGTLHWGLMLCVFSIGHIACLYMLPGADVLVPAKIVRTVRPVAAADYFLRNRAMSWFARKCVGILPFDRDSLKNGRDPFDECVQALDRGEILILFPEGSRGEPERVQHFKKASTTWPLAGPTSPSPRSTCTDSARSCPKVPSSRSPCTATRSSARRSSSGETIRSSTSPHYRRLFRASRPRTAASTTRRASSVAGRRGRPGFATRTRRHRRNG